MWSSGRNPLMILPPHHRSSQTIPSRDWTPSSFKSSPMPLRSWDWNGWLQPSLPAAASMSGSCNKSTTSKPPVRPTPFFPEEKRKEIKKLTHSVGPVTHVAVPVLAESLFPTLWLANGTHQPQCDLWLCQGSGTLEDPPNCNTWEWVWD